MPSSLYFEPEPEIRQIIDREDGCVGLNMWVEESEDPATTQTDRAPEEIFGHACGPLFVLRDSVSKSGCVGRVAATSLLSLGKANLTGELKQ